MKKIKKLTALMLSIAMIVTLMAGCGQNNAQGSSDGGSSAGAESGPVQFVDDAGRTVEIPSPSEIEKVYVTSPIGFIQIYTLDPSLCAGTPMKFSENELQYLDPICKDLEMLGGLQVGSELNKEAIISSGAQIIFSLSPSKISDTTVSDADELQAQLNIPVVVIDAMFESMPASYRKLGEIFGMEERAEELAVYCEDVLKNVNEKMAAIPEEEKISVYYAENEDGLATEPETSSHAAALKMAGAKNVATVEGNKGSGLSPVSLEQVLAWNPEVIISWGEARGGAYNKIKTDPDWASIDAVKNGRVYAMPNQPFSWMDRPPSVNRFLGVQWVANLLYPEIYDIDLAETTKEFYSLFYHTELTDEQVEEIIKDAV